MKNVVAGAIFISLLCSCNSSFYCYLNSRGGQPEDKTYFVTTRDSLLNSSLEYREYLQQLSARLNEVGYIETDSISAAIKVVFEYNLGNLCTREESVSGYKTVITQTPATTTTTISTSGTLSFSSTPGYSKVTRVPVTKTHSVSEIPLTVHIFANENLSNEPIWDVVISDVVQRVTQVPAVVPYLILCAKDYFGKDSVGEQRVIVKQLDAVEKYGLIWPY